MVGALRGSGRKKTAVLASKMVILTKQNGDISQTRRFNHHKLEVTYPMWEVMGISARKMWLQPVFLFVI
jgi:hypothetical protein